MGAGLSPGDRVGPFVVLFRLGKGGMGEVWAATQDPERLDGLVALKILHSERAQDLLMFWDEAKAALSLEHPAIVATHELGESGGQPFIAMELIQGPSLSALLQRVVIAAERLEPIEVAYLGIQVGRALDYANTTATHEGRLIQLIHRDVSPHNILLGTDGSIRLTDFGVARTAIQEHRSRVGTVRGKPSYMAPEQVSGGRIDARTDVFALGIVLYECSALRRLFGRKNPVKSMDAVIRHTPKALTELVPDFPIPLARTIATALRKNPNDRYPSAAALVRDLEEAYESMGGGRPEGLLAARVARHFEPLAFDAQHRAREALALARAHAQAEAPEVHTTVWPSAYAPDPLDPEALEVVRTEYRPAEGVRALAEPGLEALSTGLSGTRTSLTGSSSTFAAVGRPTVLLWVAALLLAGVAATVVYLRVGTSRRASVSEAPNPPAPRVAPTVRATPQPSARVIPSPPAAPERTPTVAPAAPPEETRPAAPTRRARPSGRSAKPSRETAAKRADATFDEVRALLKKVRAADQSRGSQMLVTLIEAGRGNTRQLNALRDEALRFLAKRPAPQGPDGQNSGLGEKQTTPRRSGS